MLGCERAGLSGPWSLYAAVRAIPVVSLVVLEATEVRVARPLRAAQSVPEQGKRGLAETAAKHLANHLVGRVTMRVPSAATMATKAAVMWMTQPLLRLQP